MIFALCFASNKAGGVWFVYNFGGKGVGVAVVNTGEVKVV